MSTPASKPSESYPYGIDYAWSACDAMGQVAIFTSAGMGPMPSEALKCLSLTDSFVKTVRTMPTRGLATMLVSLPDPTDFIHFAGCGFFAYDWQDVHRTQGFSRRYEMLSRPDKPIYVSDLPEQFQSLLRGTAFADLRFSDSPTIDVRAYFSCEPAV